MAAASPVQFDKTTLVAPAGSPAAAATLGLDLNHSNGASVAASLNKMERWLNYLNSPLKSRPEATRERDTEFGARVVVASLSQLTQVATTNYEKSSNGQLERFA